MTPSGTRCGGWHTLHVDHAVTGVGDTPNPVRPEYQVDEQLPVTW
ncbi:hypothetical protein ABGB18_14325 [Nonomuraea sp. B12E4]